MRIVVVGLFVLCLSGCSGIKSFAQMAGEANQLKDALKTDLGDDVSVNMNWSNGSTFVTVNIKTAQVKAVTVGDLERKVKKEVAAVLKRSATVYIVAETFTP